MLEHYYRKVFYVIINQEHSRPWPMHAREEILNEKYGHENMGI